MTRSRLNQRRICPFLTRRSARRGITLFEVLLALGIFLGAIAAIGQVINVGTLAATEGQLRSEAILRCEAKLAEVIAGVEPMVAVQEQPFVDDGRWLWSLSIIDGPHPDLLQLDVSVTHQQLSRTENAGFTLTRLVRNPQLFIDAAATEVSP
ncbi:MAG: hypothetical protein KDA86_04240 [Planctomycetaceae bacterium]|nr:hypothetical protein [Planctomycetaceae bacterium]